MSPVITTVITGVFSVLVAVITSGWFAKKMMKDDRIEELAKDLKVIKERQLKIDDAIETWKKEDLNLKEANVALLKDRFECQANNALDRGTITVAELNAITKLSVPYFKLDDADGTGHVLLEKVRQLPLEKSKHEKREDA